MGKTPPVEQITKLVQRLRRFASPVFATEDLSSVFPEATLEGLLKDTGKLKEILTYHVIPGKVMASDVAKLHSAKTVQGQSLTVTSNGSVNTPITMKYFNAISAATPELLLRNLTDQMFELAKICQDKMGHLNKARFPVLLLFCSWLVNLGVGLWINTWK